MPSWSWNCSILACCCGTEKPQVQPKHSSSPHLPIELVQASNPNPVSHTCSNPSPLHTLGNPPPGEGSQNSPSKHPRQPMGLTKDTPELSSSATDSTGVQTQLDTSPDTVSAAPGQPGWPRTSSSSSSLRPAHSLEIRRAREVDRFQCLLV